MNKPDHINWEHYSEKIEISDVKEVEEALGIRFPKDYVECMLKFNDGCPALAALMLVK